MRYSKGDFGYVKEHVVSTVSCELQQHLHNEPF